MAQEPIILPYCVFERPGNFTIVLVNEISVVFTLSTTEKGEIGIERG